MLMRIVSAIKSVDFTDSAAGHAVNLELNADCTKQEDYSAVTRDVVWYTGPCDSRPDAGKLSWNTQWRGTIGRHAMQKTACCHRRDGRKLNPGSCQAI